MTAGLWIIFTLIGALAQSVRNIMQRSLTGRLGTVGATHVRFLFGLPFALVFFAGMVWTSGMWPPAPTKLFLVWVSIGALAQIIATALMLAAMQARSFLVTIAYTKTEPVLVALFGVVVLGDHLAPMVVAAVLVATAGVVLMSWPGRDAARELLSWRPAMLGLLSAAGFAVAAIGYRGAILELNAPLFTLGATTTLLYALVIQTVLLTGWLLLRDRAALVEILRAWRPSLMAGFMGAFASQMWFLAFALESAAKVRTLALVEILIAQVISLKFLKEGLSRREALAIALVVAGVAVILNG